MKGLVGADDALRDIVEDPLNLTRVCGLRQVVVEPRLGGPPPILGLLTELEMLGKTDYELVPQADADTLARNPLAPIRYALPFRGQLERRRLDVAPLHTASNPGDQFFLERR